MVIAGVDEAGRGALCGPVVAAAVILDASSVIAGVRDSKKLTARRRECLFNVIQSGSVAYHIAEASEKEVDQYNVLQASLLAMQRAVLGLHVVPDLVLVDGPFCPILPMPVEGIIKGDSKNVSIAAASILAKVFRDHKMVLLDQKWPNYGMAQHKGYPTGQHLMALKKYGSTEIHRKTFRPVAELLEVPCASVSLFSK